MSGAENAIQNRNDIIGIVREALYGFKPEQLTVQLVAERLGFAKPNLDVGKRIVTHHLKDLVAQGFTEYKSLLPADEVRSYRLG